MKPQIPYFMLAVLVMVLASSANEGHTAIETYRFLRHRFTASRDRNDWQANLEDSRELKTFLNGMPNTLIQVARASANEGDWNGALRNLEQFARMGQSADLTQWFDLAVLSKDRRFTKIRKALIANRTPISLASTAFVLSDSDLLAEDLDFDPASKRFLVTSVREKKIISADSNGRLSDFARAPDPWPMLALKVDPMHRLVWATEVALQGYIFAPQTDWGRAAILCYDLQNGKLLRRVEGPRGSAFGDMALDPDGNVIVSDGFGGGVYRLVRNGDALERLDKGDFISPQTPVMHPDGKEVFVPDYLRGVGLLEIVSGRVQWLSTQDKFALSGIDGLYFNRGILIAVQNGSSPERVVTFKLDSKFTKIKAEVIIERSTSTLGEPSHGVVIRDDFYYIANSGWDEIDDHGKLREGSKPSLPRVMTVKLKSLFSRQPRS